MNSTQLQKDFPEVYRDFFSKNDLVVSGCFSMSWGNEGVLHQSQYLTIGSKIPLKCYIWLKKRSDSEVVFENIISFDFRNKTVISHPYGEIMKESPLIVSAVKKFLRESQMEKWISISILTEVPRGHSFWFSDTSSAILSSALHLFVWKTQPNIFDDYEGFLHSSEYENIRNYAWELSLIARKNNTIGQHIRYLLSNSSLPIFIYSQNFNNNSPISQWEFWDGMPLNVYQKEFSIQSHISDLPLDYGIIYSGISTSSNQIEDSKEADFTEFKKYESFIKNDLWIGESDSFLDVFSNTTTIVESYEKILSFWSIQTAYFLKGIIESWISFQAMHEFIQHINNLRKLISILSKENHFAELLSSIFQQKKRLEMEEIGILPSYSTKLWGGILFVMRQWISQDTLNETMVEIQKFYPNAYFDYCSYQDGFVHQWVVIEQYITKNIFSKYIQKNHCIYNDNRGASYTDTRINIIENESKGLLIDLVEKKIYLNGVKLTSKEIPAQSSTSEILAILFDKMGEEVHVDNFSSSSYSSNKNEMLGKIVLPLVKTIKDRNEIDLPFICKWSITDFYLSLKETTLPIGIIRWI